MSNTTDTTENSTRTLVQFDLAQELTAEELAKFQEAADAAGAKSLTEHFLNLTLRLMPEFHTAA